jgi:hypothetical protein
MVLLALVAAVGAFALAFLVSHHGAPQAAPARVVDAKIKAGPSAAKLKTAFGSANIAPLIKPKVKKKPVTTTTTAAAAVDPTPVTETPAPVESDPTPAYTPPATSSAPATHSAPAKKKAPSGGGVITIG